MGVGPADFYGDAFSFVDVATEKMRRLDALDEIAHGCGSGVQAGTDLIEYGAVRRGVADEDQRVKLGERFEVFGDLRFGVFAGGIERGGTGVTESCDAPVADREVAPVEVVEAALIAEGGNLGCRFVVAGKYPDLFAARPKDLAASIEAPAPGGLVAGGDVEIGLHGENAFERPPISMDVGEYK